MASRADDFRYKDKSELAASLAQVLEQVEAERAAKKQVARKATTDKVAAARKAREAADAGKKKPAAKPPVGAKTIVPLDIDELPPVRELEDAFTPQDVRKMIRENCGKGKRFASQKIFAETVLVGIPALGKYLGHSGTWAGCDSYVYLHAGTWFMRDDPALAEKRQKATEKRGHKVGYKMCRSCGRYFAPKAQHWCMPTL